MRIAVVLISALALSGCADHFANQAFSRVSPYLGKPLDSAIERFGIPNEEKTVAGRHLVIWHRRTGLQGNVLLCDLVMQVDPSNIVTNAVLQGQTGACYF